MDSKKKCATCYKYISSVNYTKHEEQCKKKNKRAFEDLKLSNGKYKCPHCAKEYTSKGIGTHIWRAHTSEGKSFTPNDTGVIWNKGLTKETDKRVEELGRSISKSLTGRKGKPLTKEEKKKVSDSMKRAHAEGRAWNIGKSRWNNKPSYPEIFFANVIRNEFVDKNYKPEHNVSIYSIDFAWPKKKRAIEIDGEQHYRFDEYIERDKRKDKCLKENNWKILRIRWVDMYNEPKKWIKVAKEFIDD